MTITPEVLGAERIEFFVGPVELTVWVEDLETYAADGTITQRFSLFARNLNDDQRRQLQSFLNWRLDANLSTIAQFTYWQVGERFLDRLGQVVQTNSLLNGSRPLRAAMIAAAADGDGVTPLELIQAFPLDTVQLNYALATQLIQENQTFFANRDTVMAQLRTRAKAAATPVEALSLAKDPVAPGRFTWQKETLTFQNPLREGDIPFELYRPLRPATDAIPVVVISHGVASNRYSFTYLAEHLASHGYAVAIPEHDDDTQKYQHFLAGVDRPPNPITLISRPLDISHTLDTLDNLAQTHEGYANLNLTAVGVLGHSLGGYTVLAAAGAGFDFEALRSNCSLEERDRPSLNLSLLVQCDLLDLADEAPFQLHDQRIQAVLAISPPTSLFFGPSGLSQIDVPTLMVAATADIVVPAIPEQIQPFQWLQTEHCYLVVMENGTHFSFLGGNTLAGAIPLPMALLGPSPEYARPYLEAVGLAFFDRYLLNDRAAEQVLDQAYFDAQAPGPFEFMLLKPSPSL
ncbi:MAG: alpha/beta hydrolase [Nodosilinea sp.]